MKQSYIEETRAERVRNLSDPVCYERSIIPVKERKWKKYSCLSIVQRNNALNKFVMILVRNYDQDERDTDGAVHWNTISSKLMREFGSTGARGFSEKDWLRHIYEGSNKTRFEYCENSKKSLMYIRAIQGHTGGNMIAPELMGHVAIPCNWKEFVLHGGCSLNIKSIVETGIIAGGRESKEGRQTIFFTSLNPF